MDFIHLCVHPLSGHTNTCSKLQLSYQKREGESVYLCVQPRKSGHSISNACYAKLARPYASLRTDPSNLKGPTS